LGTHAGCKTLPKLPEFRLSTRFSPMLVTWEGLVKSTLESKSFGFEGKGCIHPRQIQPIHTAFAPTSREIEKAMKIVMAFEDALSKGLAAVSLGTKMIDPACG
jgi:citrate lyase beta subunit